MAFSEVFQGLRSGRVVGWFSRGYKRGYQHHGQDRFDDGFFRMSVSYVRPMVAGGVFYYYRRIPSDLRKFYNGRLFRKVSLNTRDLKEAAKKASVYATQDTAH